MSMHLSRNPELIRNLWLEITLQRLLAAPVILALLVLAVFALVGDHPWQPVTYIAAIGFVAVTVFWGAKQASDAQTEEFSLGTWDAQRISGLSAGQMLVGKLFGGAGFAWYAGCWCLLVFLIGGLQTLAPGLVLRYLLGLLSAAILMQALALLTSLLSWRKLRQVSSRQTRGVSFLFALLILPNLGVMLYRAVASDATLHWFDFELPRSEFLLVSLLAFTGWAVLAAHRAMRAELQFSNQPWSWIAFVIFIQTYAAGFIDHLPQVTDGTWLASLSTGSIRWCLAALLPLLFGYCFLLTERKDPVRLARLVALIQLRQQLRAIALMPIWAISFLLTALTALLAVIAVMLAVPNWQVAIGLAAGFSAVLLFAVRDIALVLWCNLGSHQRRADGAALAYLAVLYGLLPVLIIGLDSTQLMGLVVPALSFNEPFWLLAAAAWAAAGLALLRRRWHTHTGSLV